MDEYLIPRASFERLMREYRKYGSLNIGYDFDGTVNDYHGTGASYEMVKQLLKDLKAIGCKLVCWTAYEHLGYVAEFLEKNSIPFDAINDGGIPLPWETRKVFFSALLDDRAGLLQVYTELRELADIIMKENDKSP